MTFKCVLFPHGERGMRSLQCPLFIEFATDANPNQRAIITDRKKRVSSPKQFPCPQLRHLHFPCMSLTDTQFPPFQYVGSSDDEDYDPDHESDDPLTATRPLRKRPANRTAVPLVREHRPTDDSSSPEPLSYEIPRGRLLPCGKQGCQARLGSLELLKKVSPRSLMVSHRR